MDRTLNEQNLEFHILDLIYGQCAHVGMRRWIPSWQWISYELQTTPSEGVVNTACSLLWDSKTSEHGVNE